MYDIKKLFTSFAVTSFLYGFKVSLAITFPFTIA